MMAVLMNAGYNVNYDPSMDWEAYCDSIYGTPDAEPDISEFLCEIPWVTDAAVRDGSNVATALLKALKFEVPEEFRDEYVRSFNREWVDKMARIRWMDYRDDAGMLEYTLVGYNLRYGGRMDTVTGTWDEVWAYADAHAEIDGEPVNWDVQWPRDTRRVRELYAL
jgi:hypothetical protein